MYERFVHGWDAIIDNVKTDHVYINMILKKQTNKKKNFIT